MVASEAKQKGCRRKEVGETEKRDCEEECERRLRKEIAKGTKEELNERTRKGDERRSGGGGGRKGDARRVLILVCKPLSPDRPCTQCTKVFKKHGSLMSHQTQKESCRLALARAALADRDLNAEALPIGFSSAMDDFETLEEDPPQFDGPPPLDREVEEIMDDIYTTFEMARPPRSAEPPAAEVPIAPQPPQPSPKTSLPAIIIDTFDDAGQVLHKEQGTYERWVKKHGCVDNPYHPFTSKLEWEVARWAKLEGPGAAALDRLLHYPSVSSLFILGDRRTSLHKY